jgi:subtilisin family serine protease
VLVMRERALALAVTAFTFVCAPVAHAASSHTTKPTHKTTKAASKNATPYAPPAQWGLQAIGAPTVWGRGGHGQRITVAIVDSGANLAHRDLAPNLWVNPGEIPGNGIDDDHDGYVDDVNGWDFVTNSATPTDTNGHGTHVAGIVGGACVTVCGVAPQAKLMIVRVLDNQALGDASNVARGIEFAVDHGAKIINLSLAGPDADPELQQALGYAANAGVIVVTAAGNGAVSNDTTPSYPASFQAPNELSVAATDSFGRLGAESDYGRSVNIAAPGNSILSTAMSGGMEWRTGTSMAAPMVAGALADLWSLAPKATWQQVRNSVLVSATRGLPVSSGLLNLPNALAALTGQPYKSASTKSVAKKPAAKRTVRRTDLHARSSSLTGA